MLAEIERFVNWVWRCSPGTPSKCIVRIKSISMVYLHCTYSVL